jgi:hypothetical protein
MSAQQARDALFQMRDAVADAYHASDIEDDDLYRLHMARASRWALVFLAESVATQYGREQAMNHNREDQVDGAYP